MKKNYKIKVRGDDPKNVYNVWENGDVTHVTWKSDSGKSFTLAYTTKEVIHYLKEGRWIKVPSKRQMLLNLFNIDEL